MQQSLEVTIRFPNKPTADIVYRTLAVDGEPERSTTNVKLSVENNVLTALFTADFSSNPKMDAISQLKKLRTSIGHWLDSVSLVCETLVEFGEPDDKMPEPIHAISGTPRA